MSLYTLSDCEAFDISVLLPLDVDLLDFNDDTDCFVTFDEVSATQSAMHSVVVPVITGVEEQEEEVVVQTIVTRLAA